jgi:hypothetical protein
VYGVVSGVVWIFLSVLLVQAVVIALILYNPLFLVVKIALWVLLVGSMIVIRQRAIRKVKHELESTGF